MQQIELNKYVRINRPGSCFHMKRGKVVGYDDKYVFIEIAAKRIIAFKESELIKEDNSTFLGTRCKEEN
jgi:hypothetical protein